MLCVKTTLRISPIHGLGCFAAEPIAAGTIVWRLDPKFDVSIEAEELLRYDLCQQEFLKIYTYGQCEAGRKYYVLCGDHARHMNHSSQPNVIEAGHGEASNVASRDIDVGEELTCDYFSFDTDADSKLGGKG
jgi:SET domain-containing protein